MEHASSSYDYLFVEGGPNLTYTFKSHFEASYEVKFKPGPELVDNPDFGNYTFGLMIVLTDNPHPPKLPPADALMSATIARIVTDFFEARERVFVYVCDDSDSKSDSRRKLFDRWYERLKGARYLKLKVPLAVEHNGTQYSAGFVTRSDNPYFALTFESFNRRVSGEK